MAFLNTQVVIFVKQENKSMTLQPNESILFSWFIPTLTLRASVARLHAHMAMTYLSYLFDILSGMISVILWKVCNNSVRTNSWLT